MRFLLLIGFVTIIASGLADMPRPTIPIVKASASGRCFFTMVPQHWDKHAQFAGKPFGKAYELMENGELRELWGLEDFYAFEFFLSNDGRYLVTVNDWPEGSSQVSKDDGAVAFYDRGKLLRQFSTADLVKDKSKVQRSASHYRWIFQSREDGEDPPCQGALRYSDPENTFHLTTIDGIAYVFDATTGEITGSKGHKVNKMK